ncbi:hypothetical protein CRYUN_Cryun34aG0034000 [Craigia yunnanensis]
MVTRIVRVVVKKTENLKSKKRVIKGYLLRRQERRRRAALYSQRSDQIATIDVESSINEPPKSGFDPLVITSLPMFTYKLTISQVDHDDEPIEYSVCLGTIMKESTVRLLPNCKHMFHVECIASWLGSHTTCSICRAVAEPTVQPEDKELGSRLNMSHSLMSSLDNPPPSIIIRPI